MLNNPYWLQNGALPNADWVYTKGLPDVVDIAIVGAGIAGLSLGIELAQRGRNCCIIDEALPGIRSATKSDGMFLLSTPSITTTNNTEPVVFEKLISLSLESKKIFDKINYSFKYKNWCEYSDLGGLRIADSILDLYNLQDIIKFYQKLGICATFLTEQSFRVLTNVRWSIGALYIPQEGLFNPLYLVDGLVNKNRFLGNEVISGVRFANFEHLTNGKTLVIDMAGNVIQANHVVFCLGAFSTQTPIQYLRQYITSARVQYIATQQFPQSIISAIPPYAFIMGNGLDYFRVHNRRIIFGGGNDVDELPVQEIGIMADAKVNPYITSLLQARMSYHLDFIESDTLIPEYVWTRNISQTKDGLPVVGKLPGGYNNIYLHCGYGEHGTTYEFIGSKVIADLICQGNTNIYGHELFNPERFINASI